jgi:hypothetical protein
MIPDGTTVYVNTDDDWCPSYIMNMPNQLDKMMLVRVSFYILEEEKESLDPPIYRVCVRGADDLGMEFDTHERTLAESYFIMCISQESLSIEFLKDKGFVSA